MSKRRVCGVLAVVCAVGCGNVSDSHRRNGSAGDAGGGSLAGQSGSDEHGGAPGVAGAESAGGNRHFAGSAGDAGAIGDAGAAGEAGAAGSSPCSPLETHFCDDGNDCTADGCDANGCHHTPKSEGTACDDGKACTALEQCHAGACEGKAQALTPGVLGEAVGFGAYEAQLTENRLQHLVVALSEHDLVFAESVASGLEVKLIHVQDRHAKLIDHIFSYATIGLQLGDYQDDTAARLVRVNSSRVALVSSNYLIELFDIVNGRLVRGKYRSLSDDGVTVRLADAVAKDDQLWLNDGQNLYSYDVSSDGTLTPFVHVSNSSLFPRIALADDGNTLYLAGTKGVYAFDVTDRHNPVVNRTPVIAGAPNWQPTELQVHGGHLWMQTMGTLTEIGEGRLFRTDTYQPILSVSGSGADAILPLGAALGDGKLLLQRLKYRANQASQLVAQVYSLSGNTAILSAEFPYRNLERFQDGGLWQPYPPALSGTLAVLEPVGSIADLSGGGFDPIEGVEQGSLDRIRYVGESKFAAYGSDATHLIDVSSQGAPELASGGPLAVGVGSLQSAAAASAVARASLLSSSVGFNSLLTRFSADTLQAPRFVDDLQLHTPDFVAGTASDSGLLFRVTSAHGAATPADLEIFDLEAAVSNQPLVPLEKVPLPQSVMALSSPALAVDVAAQTLVLLGSDPARNGLATVAWFSRSKGNWQLTGKLELDFASDAMLLRADRAILRSNDANLLVLLGRAADGSVSVLQRRDFSTETGETLAVDRLLGVDSGRIYAATGERDTVLPSHAGVVAFDLGDLHDIAHYAVAQLPKSMAAGQGAILLGTRDRVIAIRPACE
jgi:hypothetical protein